MITINIMTIDWRLNAAIEMFYMKITVQSFCMQIKSQGKTTQLKLAGFKAKVQDKNKLDLVLLPQLLICSGHHTDRELLLSVIRPMLLQSWVHRSE